MKKYFAVAVLVILIAAPQAQAEGQVSSNVIENTISRIISQMTLEEKIDMVYGRGSETKQIKRLGIPPIKPTDGPVGINWQKSTCFPSSIAVAATFCGRTICLSTELTTVVVL